jgi:hypothetical protein
MLARMKLRIADLLALLMLRGLVWLLGLFQESKLFDRALGALGLLHSGKITLSEQQKMAGWRTSIGADGYQYAHFDRHISV